MTKTEEWGKLTKKLNKEHNNMIRKQAQKEVHLEVLSQLLFPYGDNAKIHDMIVKYRKKIGDNWVKELSEYEEQVKKEKEDEK